MCLSSQARLHPSASRCTHLDQPAGISRVPSAPGDMHAERARVPTGRSADTESKGRIQAGRRPVHRSRTISGALCRVEPVSASGILLEEGERAAAVKQPLHSNQSDGWRRGLPSALSLVPLSFGASSRIDNACTSEAMEQGQATPMPRTSSGIGSCQFHRMSHKMQLNNTPLACTGSGNAVPVAVTSRQPDISVDAPYVQQPERRVRQPPSFQGVVVRALQPTQLLTPPQKQPDAEHGVAGHQVCMAPATTPAPSAAAVSLQATSAEPPKQATLPRPQTVSTRGKGLLMRLIA